MAFERAYGRKPEGSESGSSRPALWSPSMSFTAAKRWAREEAARRGMMGAITLNVLT